MNDLEHTSIDAAMAAYARAVEAVANGRSARSLAKELQIDASTVQRIVRPNGSASPAPPTHLALTNYARRKGLTEELAALEDAWRVIDARRPRSDFERVFGREMATGPVALVLPAVRQNPRYLQRRTATSPTNDSDCYLMSASKEPAGIGLDADVTVFNDVRAAMDIQRLLAANGAGQVSEVCSDADMTLSMQQGFPSLSQSVFTFGGFNNALSVSCAASSGGLFGFTVPATNRGGIIVGEKHTFLNVEGNRIYFLIARILPNPARNPERLCIVCAGTRGTGTRAAGRYLVDQWQWFTRLAPGLNFAAVYSISGSDDPEPTLESMTSAPAVGGESIV